MLPRLPAAFAALLSPLLLTACQESSAEAPAAPPPPTVRTLVLKAEDVPLQQDYPGRVIPVRLAEVRARVSGIVLARTFSEGGDVRAGDVLFEVDPAKFAAAADAARAQVARAEAMLALSVQQEVRAEKLARGNYASRDQYDVVVANRRQAEAEVAVAEANLRTAELELGYASVRSPIAGRIGAALVTEGAFVRQEDGTQMATVRDLSAVYVDFTAALDDLEAVRRESASAGSGAEAAVDLVDAGGCPIGLSGQLLFSSAEVDETTGQVSLRAEFDNPGAALLPGAYVRVRMSTGVAQQSLLVPQRAVQWDTLGQSRVTTVENGSAVQKPVTASRTVGNRVIVEVGLAAGDEVVTDGLDRVRPGSPVTVEAQAYDSANDATAGQIDSGSCDAMNRS